MALRRDGTIDWRISRSPFQRPAGLATLTATTAAGPGRSSAPDIALGADVALGAGVGLADEAVPGLPARFLAEPAAERSAGGGTREESKRGGSAAADRGDPDTVDGSGRGGVSAEPPSGR